MLQVLMAFRMYVELNMHLSYRPIKKKISQKSLCHVVCVRQR